MPKLTKKELDQRRRLRTKANRERPKRKGGPKITHQITDEHLQLTPRYDPGPVWLDWRALEQNPLFDKLVLGK